MSLIWTLVWEGRLYRRGDTFEVHELGSYLFRLMEVVPPAKDVRAPGMKGYRHVKLVSQLTVKL